MPEVDRRDGATEEVVVRGHIIDSLLLPKILDRILQMGGSFEIRECKIGSRRVDPSFARIAVKAATHAEVEEIVGDLIEHGASPAHPEDAQTLVADLDGAFPDGFYATTNQKTEVRLKGKWVEVGDQEMDCGIVVDPTLTSARCVAMADVEEGMPIVVGPRGRPRDPRRTAAGVDPLRVHELERLDREAQGREPARRGRRDPQDEGRGQEGPARGRPGDRPHRVGRARRDAWSASGWIDVLFAGNALATHDVEQALYGTSLGVNILRGEAIEHGHEHHLRTINTIRRLGGIKAAVDAGVLTSGIMYECVKKGIDVVLAGSIRDDGPLPEVITDTLAAQARMRRAIKDVGLRADDRDGPAFGRGGELASGVGEGGLRRHQPGDRHQAERPGDVPDGRDRHRRRAVPAKPGGDARCRPIFFVEWALPNASEAEGGATEPILRRPEGARCQRPHAS